MKCQEAQEPQDEQNEKDEQEHGQFLSVLGSLILAIVNLKLTSASAVGHGGIVGLRSSSVAEATRSIHQDAAILAATPSRARPRCSRHTGYVFGFFVLSSPPSFHGELSSP
jgi:hypothetical protein